MQPPSRMTRWIGRRWTILIVVLSLPPSTSSFSSRTSISHPKSKIITTRQWQEDFSVSRHTGPTRRRCAVALQQNSAQADPFVMANTIHPETKRLLQSLSFYARFVVRYLAANRRDRKRAAKVKGARRAVWKKLNEQRKNVVNLAGYTPHIVVPSFLSLFLGALMTSVVPSYTAKCMHCVSTLTTSRAELLKAIIGLGVSSTLAALFTGLRGALFWIGGTYGNERYCILEL